MPINISLAAHILLDSELNGRFGVQGNTFMNTVSYFNAYFEQRSLSPDETLNQENLSQLQHLNVIMTQLVENERQIEAFNRSTRNPASLSDFIGTLTAQIIATTSGQQLLLPGGWLGRTVGHAMIYEFTRNEQGELLFSIYNSGAGIRFHEKHTTRDKTHFFPVKTYKIPAKIDSNELHLLVARLITPQTLNNNPAKQITYDAKVIYHSIEESMPFLHGESVLVSESITKPITTSGQISGTCAQRSIHQMLKVCFDTLPHYQRFILDFKMHALREFIAEHPAPRSIEINQMLQMAIENNLKILQEPALFDEGDGTKEQLTAELISLKGTLQERSATRPREDRAPLPRTIPDEYTIGTTQIRTAEGNGPIAHSLYPIHPDFSLQEGKISLVEQVQSLLAYCQQQHVDDPLWVIQQIESIMIHLPLPQNEQSMRECIPLYAETQDMGQVEELMIAINELRNVYQTTVKNSLGANTVPTTLVTHASFLAIYDYLDTLNAGSKSLPLFHDEIRSSVSTFVDGLKFSPHIASHHPAYDLRFKQLVAFYPSLTVQQESPLEHYQRLLETEPDLKALIQAAYDASPDKVPEKKERTLVENKWLELYFLFKQIDEDGNLVSGSPLDKETFKPLTDKLNQAIRMEQFVAANANILFQTTAIPRVKLSFDLDPLIKFHSAITDGKQQHAWQNQTRLESYPFQLQYKKSKSEDSTAYSPIDVLLADAPDYNGSRKKKTSNKIQIEQAHPISRDLYHLRTIQNSQIQLTLDYFISSIELLANPEIQRYVQANLMEPGVLCSTLNKDSQAFLKSFDAFIAQGLTHYVDQKGQMTETSLYFLQLSTAVNYYMAEYDTRKDPLYGIRLAHDQELINQTIASTANTSLLLQLHRSRFVNLVKQNQRTDGGIPLAQLTEALTSLFYLQSNNTSQESLEIIANYDFNQSERQFADLLRVYHNQNPVALTNAIKTIACTSLGITNPDEHVMEGTYPIFTLTDSLSGIFYTIQAQEGQLFNANNLRYSEMPLELRNHPTLEHLQLDQEKMCFISMDKRTIEWTNGRVRLTRNQHNSDALQSIQKIWKIKDQDAWYQYEAPVSWRSKPLPPYLTDASADSWANGTDAFIAQNNQPCFYLSQTTDAPVERYHAPLRRLAQLDEVDPGALHLLTSKASLPPSFYSFENPEFIQVTRDNANPTNGRVFLPRYGLSFHLHEDQLSLDHTDFKLEAVAKPWFKPEVAQITLRDKEDNEQCIIPIQRFYLNEDTRQVDGHEYQFTHDTTAIIAKEKVNAMKKSKQWRYLHSESSITYTLVNGVPQTNNAAEALYLAYIYLATHETDKAWDILTDISKRFPLTGNEHELTYLSWIVNALPCMLSATSEQANLQSTRVSACQLKALALLTDFLAEGKKPDIPRASSIDPTHLNGVYQQANLKEVQSFYDNLSSTIELSYSKLIDKLRDHTHETFMLSETESKSLLTYYYKHLSGNTPPTPHGTLGYEWRRLTLKTLLTEQDKLDSMRSAGQALPPGLEKRFSEVGEKLAEEVQIMGQKTILERSTVDLNLERQKPTLYTSVSEQAKSALLSLSSYISLEDEDLPQKYTDAMAKLSSSISEEDFYTNVKIYLKIAFNKQSCGLVALSIDPETSDTQTLLAAIKKIKFSDRPNENTQMQSRMEHLDIIIAFEKKLYYLDNLKQTIHKIEPLTGKHSFDALLYDCESTHSFKFFADRARLQDIVDRTGRTPINHPLTAHRKTLRDFCVKYLAGHRHTPFHKQDTLIPYLTQILYLTLESGPEFQQRYSQSSSLNFDNLHHLLRANEAAPIDVLGPKDVFSTLLATTTDILQELRDRTPKHPPISTKPSHSDDTQCLAERLPHLPEELKERLLGDYAKAELKYQQALEEGRANPEKLELTVGESLHACILTQREISKNALQSVDIRQALLKEATRYRDELSQRLEPDWRDISAYANRFIDETLKTQVAAGQKHRITPQDLRKAYFHADTAHYIELTGLSADDVATLHEKIHATMLLEVNHQHASRLQKALEKIPPTGTPDPIQLAQISTLLMTKNLPEAASDPAIMLFQYEEDILLRPRQLQAIKNLLSTPIDPNVFNASIEKVIMGGGKSKVILPLLAQKKANGTNLVIMEVPRALLATNHIDLFQTSQRLFGQKAFCFEFNRDDDCSPQRLEEIHQQFCDISTHKNYLVTTGESMQSLELKAVELLRAGPKDESQRPEWEEQVYWANKISELLKQRGDAVIDEVHQGLLHKKKLNYTLGEPLSIDRSLIDRAVNLYIFINTIQPETGITLSERVKNEWGELNMPQFLGELLTNTQSPLKQSLSVLYNLYGETFVVDELRAYFNNEKEPSFLSGLDHDLKNTLAFYKEQLQLLPQTLNRQYKVQYGPSKLGNKSTANRALAIPYSANDKPNERSRFGNALETLNYSIQSLFIEGLNRELVESMFVQWQQEARFEFIEGIYDHLEDTPTAKKVVEYLSGTGFKSLGGLDTKNRLQMEELLLCIRQKPVFLARALSHDILPQITTEPAILHSDAYNHVSLYRSTQGLSGTPSNHTTFHQGLAFNAFTSLGSDGYIQALIKHKQTPIHVIEFTQLKPYLEALLQKASVGENLHALIDISATFAGISNLEVTQALAEVYASNPALKYILYFNEADVLCAYSIQQRTTVVLASSSPGEINKQLQCTPNERFTYYDQAHTVGTDLKQAPSASALCLVDEKTQTQNFLQGAMRMRELSENQSIQMVVPPSMAGQALEDMLETMRSNEKSQILNDNFYATVAKLHNVMRDHALQRIASLDDRDIRTKQLYMSVFDAYFVDVQQGDLFAEYGSIYAMQKPGELLEQLILTLTQEWDAHTKTLSLPCTEEDRASLQQKLQKVVEISLPHCPELVKSPLHNNQGKEVEVEAEKEQEMKKEIEQLAQQETKTAYVTEETYVPWNDHLLSQFIKQGRLLQTFGTPQIAELNSACNTGDEAKPLFSPALMMTTNYSTVYKHQQKDGVINSKLKPIHIILYRLGEEGLSSVLVSNQEAAELIPLLDKPGHQGPPHVWLSTTQHTSLAGHPPEDLLFREDYHAHLEQIRYFSGNFVELLKQPTPYLWLTQGTEEKLDYFKKNIMPYRRTEDMQFGRLKHLLLTPEPGFDYMDEHAFSDLTTVHWAKKYPKALPAELATYSHLAKAIRHANQTFHTLAGLSKPIPPTFLSERARTHYQAHQAKLDQLTVLLGKIQSMSPDQQLIDVIDSTELLRLEAFLGINVNVLKTMHQIDSATPKEAISYQALNLELLTSLAQSPYIGDKTKPESLLQTMSDAQEAAPNLDDLPVLTTTAIPSTLELEIAPAIRQQHEWARRARDATTYVEFRGVINEADATGALYEKPLVQNLIDNPKFPQSLFRQLLKNPKAPVAFLNEVLSSAHDDDRLAILQHPGLPYDIYRTIINHPDLSEAVYSAAVQHNHFKSIKAELFADISTISPEHIKSLMQHAKPPLNSTEIDTLLSKNHWPQDVLTTLLSTQNDLTRDQAVRIAVLATTPETIDRLLLHPKENALIFTDSDFADCLFNPARALPSTETSLQLLGSQDLTPEFMSRYLTSPRLIEPLTQDSVKANFIRAIKKHEDWFVYTTAENDTLMVDLFGPFIIKYYRQLSDQLGSDHPLFTDLLRRNSTNRLADNALAVIAENNPEECIKQLLRTDPITNSLGEKTFIMILTKLSGLSYLSTKITPASMIQFFIQQMDSASKRTAFFSFAPQILVMMRALNPDGLKQILNKVLTTTELQHILSAVIKNARFYEPVSDDMIEPIIQHSTFNAETAGLIIMNPVKISSSTALTLIKHPVCTLDLLLKLRSRVSIEDRPLIIEPLKTLLSERPPVDKKEIIMQYLDQPNRENVEFICDHLSPDEEILQKIIKVNYSEKTCLTLYQYMGKHNLDMPSIRDHIIKYTKDDSIRSKLVHSRQPINHEAQSVEVIPKPTMKDQLAEVKAAAGELEQTDLSENAALQANPKLPTMKDQLAEVKAAAGESEQTETKSRFARFCKMISSPFGKTGGPQKPG